MAGEVRVVQARAPYALARALAATVLTVTGAASAHTWAGGDVPTAPGLALIAAVVLAASLLVLRRGVPAPVLLPVVAVAQLGVHSSFGLVSSHDHMTGAATDSGWSWQMVAAHAFVTALTAVLWWAARRAAAYAVHLVARPALPVAGQLRRPVASATPVAHVHLLVPLLRGPPAAVLPT
ncbi:hypothetical protein [Nocardioides lacusdianchii]|uniref:hypothetical protein n=1 Tax=Nocardioides lacusdianchii TaxID=2783664 RepID=UPI001CCF8F14|nr:hypothetical protein [Nocardioides lacusdianchii]